MRLRGLRILGFACALAFITALAGRQASSTADARKEIEAFNKRFEEVTLRMDNAGLMALWAEDGVTLLPGMAAMEGKQTIAKWLDGLTAQMPGYRVAKQLNDFKKIQISGDWATEWGTTYQVIQPPDGKPPMENYGKILLVLHKEKDGQWRITEEMWNQGVKP